VISTRDKTIRLALQGEEYIDKTSNWRTSSPDTLHIGMTDVRQAFMRCSIAFVFKDRAIKARQQYGAPHLKTDNKSSYQPIFKLKEKLDFTRRCEWARYEKEISSNA